MICESYIKFKFWGSWIRFYWLTLTPICLWITCIGRVQSAGRACGMVCKALHGKFAELWFRLWALGQNFLFEFWLCLLQCETASFSCLYFFLPVKYSPLYCFLLRIKWHQCWASPISSFLLDVTVPVGKIHIRDRNFEDLTGIWIQQTRVSITWVWFSISSSLRPQEIILALSEKPCISYMPGASNP